MLSVGIVGLPNAGKSTLFNALTAGEAVVASYPFTTIEPNVGQVPVPDPRLEALAGLVAPKEVTPCFIRFLDIAGLVRGASQGEGLGNQFLGEIRQVDAVAHVVRCFEHPDVAHVEGDVDPVRDLELIETELLLADLEVMQRAVEKRRKLWSTHPKEHAREMERWERLLRALGDGVPLRRLELDAEDRREQRALGLLTGRPMICVANVGEDELGSEEPPRVKDLAASSLLGGAPVVRLAARLEAELQELEPKERREMAAELGLGRSGLERLVESAFDALGLIRFYTLVSGKLRAWEIPRGTHAPQAAGSVHSDMERGFIRAQVARFEELVEHGGLHELRGKGKIHTQGRDYEVQDGDVVEFLFNA